MALSMKIFDRNRNEHADKPSDLFKMSTINTDKWKWEVHGNFIMVSFRFLFH